MAYTRESSPNGARGIVSRDVWGGAPSLTASPAASFMLQRFRSHSSSPRPALRRRIAVSTNSHHGRTWARTEGASAAQWAGRLMRSVELSSRCHSRVMAQRSQ